MKNTEFDKSKYIAGAYMHKQLNMELDKIVSISTEDMSWSPSPASGVERRQLEREAAESGRTTSVVRYAPNSSFPQHVHDGGEEFLVLKGVFSDEYGDYPKGTYVRNPPGSQHAPYTKSGCTIFVKLGQFHEHDKNRTVLDSHTRPWVKANEEGIEVKVLHRFNNELVQIESWEAHTEQKEGRYMHGHEVLILEGDLQVSGRRFTQGSWVRSPAGSLLTMHSNNGCLLYTKQGHL